MAAVFDPGGLLAAGIPVGNPFLNPSYSARWGSASFLAAL